MRQTAPHVYNERLHVDCRDMTINEIANDIGVSYNSVRLALKRRGLSALPECGRTLRQQVQSMKPADAVEHLLCALELLEAVQPSGDHPVDALNVHFTYSERRLLVALYDTPGILTKDACYNAVYFDTLESPEQKIVDVFVCKIRAKLPPEFGCIETVWGRGYRFEGRTS